MRADEHDVKHQWKLPLKWGGKMKMEVHQTQAQNAMESAKSKVMDFWVENLPLKL